MLTFQDITYIHSNRDLLFSGIYLNINKHDKIALTGHNGSGKSTLLKLLAGTLPVTSGLIKTDVKPYLVPQVFGQFNDYTVARALQVDTKLKAFREILDGHATVENMTVLDDDWSIEERCAEAFKQWELPGLDLNQKMKNLSGGQKTKVFLAGINIHRPELVLLDEPSNHLDSAGRDLLYDYIQSTKATLLVVSHDRTLLNLLHTVFELSKRGITVYGGNYDFYAAQKAIEHEALSQDVKSKEKALRKAREIEKEAMERQQKLDSRGKKKQEKAGLPTIMMNTFRNNAEKSTSRIKGVHTEKINAISQDLGELRKALPDADKMKIGFNHSGLHHGKLLVEAKDLNFSYGTEPLWTHPLNFQLSSGERIALKGLNGSGKTTLIKIILGELKPVSGSLETSAIKSVYIDQDYALIRDELSVYKQVQQYNSGVLQEHEIKIRLARFLFGKEDWDKPCKALSGGERMRLILCTLTVSQQAPDMIILDEPTNNLDIQNIEMLITAINEYQGTLLVVSHDAYFLGQIHVARKISMD